MHPTIRKLYLANAPLPHGTRMLDPVLRTLTLIQPDVLEGFNGSSDSPRCII